jgi:hypothetical protein
MELFTMTVWVLFGWILMATALLAALSILFLLLSSRLAKSAATEEQRKYSAERYRPMRRLVSGTDLQFLQSVPGCNPEIARRYSKAQRRVLGTYVRHLKLDFRRLHRQARLLLANRDATAADSHLLWILMRQRFEFERRIALLESRLALGSLGVTMPSVEPLLEMMNAMRLQVNQIDYSSAA